MSSGMRSVTIKRGGATGVGIQFEKANPGPFKIKSLTEGGSAALSGKIKAGDLLHGVNDNSVYELDPMQTTQLILGPPGSEIILWIAPAADSSKPQRVVLNRAGTNTQAGIGISFEKPGKGPYTIKTLAPGGPAQASGQIKEGELLHGVGDKPVYELNPAETTALIVGAAGSEVTLWISDADYKPPAAGVPADAPSAAATDVVFTRNAYGGLGINFAKADAKATMYTVAQMAPCGPAARSGNLKLGDGIVTVDGAEISSLLPAEVTKKIVGQPYTQVTLGVSTAPDGKVAPTFDGTDVSIKRGENGVCGIGFGRVPADSLSGPYVVQQLVPSGAAAASGLAIGDEIHCVGYVGVSDKTVEQVRALLIGHGTPGSIVVVGVKKTNEAAGVGEVQKMPPSTTRELPMASTTTSRDLPVAVTTKSEDEEKAKAAEEKRKAFLAAEEEKAKKAELEAKAKAAEAKPKPSKPTPKPKPAPAKAKPQPESTPVTKLAPALDNNASVEVSAAEVNSLMQGSAMFSPAPGPAYSPAQTPYQPVFMEQYVSSIAKQAEDTYEIPGLMAYQPAPTMMMPSPGSGGANEMVSQPMVSQPTTAGGSFQIINQPMMSPGMTPGLVTGMQSVVAQPMSVQSQPMSVYTMPMYAGYATQPFAPGAVYGGYTTTTTSEVGGMPSNMALYTTQDGDTSNGFQKGNSISVPNVPTGDVSAEGAPGVEMY
jgi:C-terminal processing protease CtpA/Prc